MTKLKCLSFILSCYCLWGQTLPFTLARRKHRWGRGAGDETQQNRYSSSWSWSYSIGNFFLWINWNNYKFNNHSPVLKFNKFCCIIFSRSVQNYFLVIIQRIEIFPSQARAVFKCGTCDSTSFSNPANHCLPIINQPNIMDHLIGSWLYEPEPCKCKEAQKSRQTREHLYHFYRDKLKD